MGPSGAEWGWVGLCGAREKGWAYIGVQLTYSNTTRFYSGAGEGFIGFNENTEIPLDSQARTSRNQPSPGPGSRGGTKWGRVVLGGAVWCRGGVGHTLGFN